MKNKRNQQSGKGILRRFLAKTLALTMVLGFLTPAAPMTVYAGEQPAVELKPEDLGDVNCESTIGVIRKTSNGHPDLSFDIQGIVSRAYAEEHGIENPREYMDGTDGGFNTTYRNNGYQTWLRIRESHKETQIKCEANGGAVLVNRKEGEETVPDVEMKMTVEASPDNQYIYVNYYVYNRENRKKRIYFGSWADTQINGHGSGSSDPADSAALFITDAGFHMLNTENKSAFDCYTSEKITGMPAPDKQWVGGHDWSDRVQHIFTNKEPDSEGKREFKGGDSDLAYSWTVDLRPFELVQRRVAFACRVNSYYVSSSLGSDDNDDDPESGTYQKPYKTLEHAIEKIGSDRGYIYVMDYQDIDSPIEISDWDANITIASTDFNQNGTSTLGLSDAQRIKTLKRKAGYRGELFRVEACDVCRFRDITLSGNEQESESPVLSIEGGSVDLSTKATVTGARGTAADKGSAINASEGAIFGMSGGTVTGNKSAIGGKGAVYCPIRKAGDTAFLVKGESSIIGNEDMAGAPANAYLSNGAVIAVCDADLKNGRIGVTSEKLPATMPGSFPTESNQEIPVAKFDKWELENSDFEKEQFNPGDHMEFCTFSDNFTADQEGTKGVRVSSGANDFGNLKKAVLRRSGHALNFVYVDTQGMAVSTAENREGKAYAAGDPVEEAAPLPAPSYTLKKVTVEQGDQSSLQAVSSGTDMGKITGTMPNRDVTVTYTYEQGNSSISFQENGGEPKPAAIEGNIGDDVNAMLPQVSKYGYKFYGWVEGQYDRTTGQWAPPVKQDYDRYTYVTDLPAVFPAQPLQYYAIFGPDPNVKFDYRVAYQNRNGSITFQSKASAGENGLEVEHPISAERKPIPGYKWSKTASRLQPEKFDFYDGNGAQGFGAFDGDGHFSGKMPGQNTWVTYRYEVDRSSAKTPITVKYVTEDGRRIAPDFTGALFPEEPISVSPKNLYGYDLVKKEVTKGATVEASGKDADGPLVSTVKADGFDAAGTFTGVMPNQPVEITYTYQSNGEGYRFQVQHKDTESKDSRLQNIVPAVTETHPADTGVSAEVQDVYGYVFTNALENGQTSPGIGRFDGAHKYTALMPADDLSVTYQYGRNSSQWATIHYDGGLYGALSHDNEREPDDPNKKVSPDVIKDQDGSYLTEVLKPDNQGHGDTWADVKKKRLVPLVSLDFGNAKSKYYRFAGWFIDGNGNKKVDGNETLISEDQTFAGDTTLTAAFEEDPDKWVDVQLTAGDHGTLIDNNTGALISTPVTIHTHYDSKWGDLLLPNNKPEVNYLKKGWYDGARKIEDHDSLRNGATYTLQFYPDPLVFGTNAGDVDAAGSLDEDGKGRVTAFDTKPGYRYFITDLDGTILDVQDGSVTGRTVFDKLCPGTRYLVYEAEGSSDAAPGMKATEVRGKHGDSSEVLTPVVERNYQITYDTKHEDKTVLTIEPADRDADYALLDQEGHVVHTQESGADGWQTPVKKPGRVVFSGLDYNGVYTVVARPKGKSGVTAESKRPDGTELTMDPGGELEIPKFTVKTVNGTVKTVGEHTVNGEEYEEAHRGDSVRVSAEAENDAGQRFRAWRVLVGAVSGLGAKLKALVFDFTMPDTNVVFSAEYERSRQSSPSNARVTDEVRGGNPGEMALDPEEVSGLEESLTTDKDRELMDVNHADVTYKVVYQKGRVKATVSNALRKSEFYTENSHKSAYTEAWDLGVLIERYVNGRRVGRTTPSDAAFNTYVQLDREDVDMMDYALYEYRKDPQEPTGYEVIPVALVGDPEETGGLFQFTARPGAHYVLTYSKAYHLTFLNEHSQSQSKYDFKVRKGEAPSDAAYETDYEKLEQPDPHVTDDQGIEYQYQDWSRRRDKLRVFDADQPIQKRTYVYAYYKDNGPEVRNTRKQLDDAIREAARRADDFFLKRKETGEILDAVKEALAVFEKKAPAATAAELQEALDKLKRSMEPYDRTLDKRYDHYGRINTERNVGGSGGGGGGRGAGVQASPFVPESPKSYVVGTNGSWELLNAEKHEWAFVLNGGIRLVGRWGKLDYANGDVNRNGWYHFNAHGIMDSGWFLDEAGNWYYCNTVHDGWFGKMKTGWHYDRDDSRWYYLDPVTGKMATGWVQIGEKWYYFAPYNEGNTWAYNEAAEKWFYLDNKRRPFGSLYQNETTPDHYRVDGDGAWVK